MRRRKGGEKKKAMVALLLFFSGWLLWRDISGRKKLLDAKGPFGDNVLKNPARCMYVCVCLCVCVCVCGCMYSAIAEKNQIVHSKENASNQM